MRQERVREEQRLKEEERLRQEELTPSPVGIAEDWRK